MLWQWVFRSTRINFNDSTTRKWLQQLSNIARIRVIAYAEYYAKFLNTKLHHGGYMKSKNCDVSSGRDLHKFVCVYEGVSKFETPYLLAHWKCGQTPSSHLSWKFRDYIDVEEQLNSIVAFVVNTFSEQRLLTVPYTLRLLQCLRTMSVN